MKISTKGRYGLRALMDMAMNAEKESITIKTISERQNISERYLEQIFSLLRKGGIIVGRKGAQGGYNLVKKQSEITIGEILKALEGENIFIDVNSQEENELENFINKNLWSNINNLIDDYLESITLEDLVNDHRKATENIIYYI
ncbi:MAG: Rrf2 family transcriptional regulator [Clostridiales bacterium]|nr:Rrf2 family transcriptional regulator [Clostridiales bacterium]